jgi:phosphatidylglycerol:prolipoprotein diacylglycerol transferase
MSFHGGFLGVLAGCVVFCRKQDIPLLRLGDLIIVTAPIGLGLGRLANFINGELYGRVTSVPWGMVFPHGGPYPRHPSQLYEAVMEGLVLFLLLWFKKDSELKPGMLVARFLIFYGIFRIVIEFFREPDSQVGYLLGILTMGQILSFLMILAALVIIFARRTEEI